MGLKKHKANAPNKVNVGIITVSSTRSMKEDKSGQWISKRVKKEGHNCIPSGYSGRSRNNNRNGS